MIDKQTGVRFSKLFNFTALEDSCLPSHGMLSMWVGFVLQSIQTAAKSHFEFEK